VLPAPDAHPELQAFHAIEPPAPFPIHARALAAQEHPDPEGAEPRPGVRSAERVGDFWGGVDFGGDVTL